MSPFRLQAEDESTKDLSRPAPTVNHRDGGGATPRLQRGPIWKHPSRLWRYYRLKLLRLAAEPETVARGLAIGVLVGLLPIVPLHTVTALGLAITLKGSKTAALLGTLVSNPFDLVPHYLLIYYLGHKLLPLDIPPFSPRHIDIREILSDGWELMAVLMTGGLVVAIPASLAAYFGCLWMVRKYRGGKDKSKID